MPKYLGHCLPEKMNVVISEQRKFDLRYSHNACCNASVSADFTLFVEFDHNTLPAKSILPSLWFRRFRSIEPVDTKLPVYRLVTDDTAPCARCRQMIATAAESCHR